MPVEIQLTKGQVAIVDEESLPLIAGSWQAKWYPKEGRYYAFRTLRVDGKKRGQYMHRLIAGAVGRTQFTDHRNRNTLDNRIENLRLCTPSQNAANSRQKNTGAYKGVRRHRRSWQAQLMINEKAVPVGFFATEAEAAKAYNIAAVNHFGEFALVNEQPELADIVPRRLHRGHHGKSGIRGVTWHNSGKWRAYRTVNRKQVHIGLFDDKHDAERAVNCFLVTGDSEHDRVSESASTSPATVADEATGTAPGS